MKFSERIGKTQPKSIQIDTMDKDLKNSLWNVIDIHILSMMKKNIEEFPDVDSYNFYLEIWLLYFKEPLDEIPRKKYQLYQEIRERFFSCDTYGVYNFIDFLLNMDNPYITKQFSNSLNKVLKRELSGYRVIDGQLSPIINEHEIESIESAIANTNTNKLKAVNIHLSASVEKLSQKPNPDYRNSIKESISAIESIARIIADEPKAALDLAIKKLKTKVKIHGALEKGYLSLYGYASDGDGIRHGLLEEPDLDQEDAIYMLVSCSAFINYLIVKASKAGISLN